MEEKMKKFQPTKVQKIVCPKCGELMIKFYPYSTYRLQEGSQIQICGKCINKPSTLKAGVA